MKIYHPKSTWKNRRDAFIGTWLEKYVFKVSLSRNTIIFKTEGEARNFYNYQIREMKEYNDSNFLSLELRGRRIKIKVAKTNLIF